MASRFTEYVSGKGEKTYEGHIWANHADRAHRRIQVLLSEFKTTETASAACSCCPTKFNASDGDLPYADKRKHYLKQNLLAQTLHEDAYRNNPGPARFLKSSGSLFRLICGLSRRLTSTSVPSSTSSWPSKSGTRTGSTGSDRTTTNLQPYREYRMSEQAWLCRVPDMAGPSEPAPFWRSH